MNENDFREMGQVGEHGGPDLSMSAYSLAMIYKRAAAKFDARASQARDPQAANKYRAAAAGLRELAATFNEVAKDLEA